jgi:hypothetical protein
MTQAVKATDQTQESVSQTTPAAAYGAESGRPVPGRAPAADPGLCARAAPYRGLGRRDRRGLRVRTVGQRLPPAGEAGAGFRPVRATTAQRGHGNPGRGQADGAAGAVLGGGSGFRTAPARRQRAGVRRTLRGSLRGRRLDPTLAGRRLSRGVTPTTPCPRRSPTTRRGGAELTGIGVLRPGARS